ncbi:hypothetical protein GCM10023340_08510 [Nocardioides marinquilinus]|uniref:Uncharacterized protein n=1 Tax=Nocardioides marinquilinus TaxID=1210400 RepID=A0ABP9PF97_9ACTN
MIKLKHTETGDTIEVDDGREGPYLTQGWEKAPTAKAGAPKKLAAPKTTAKTTPPKPAQTNN